MAGKQFIFNTNVGITENYATNFFDVSGIQITANTDLSITSTEKCAEVLGEMANIYSEIQTYCSSNIEEKDIYTFTSKLEDAMRNTRPNSLQKISFTVAAIEIPNEVFLNRAFYFA